MCGLNIHKFPDTTPSPPSLRWEFLYHPHYMPGDNRSTGVFPCDAFNRNHPVFHDHCSQSACIQYFIMSCDSRVFSWHLKPGLDVTDTHRAGLPTTLKPGLDMTDTHQAGLQTTLKPGLDVTDHTRQGYRPL